MSSDRAHQFAGWRLGHAAPAVIASPRKTHDLPTLGAAAPSLIWFHWPSSPGLWKQRGGGSSA
jgi:hypothetical protein